MHANFSQGKIALSYIYKTNAPIRNLTSPHIVIIIVSYLLGFNLNLSDATRLIFNTRIKCSTNILSEASSLFLFFCDSVSSPFFAKSSGQKLLSGELRGFFVGVFMNGSPI